MLPDGALIDERTRSRLGEDAMAEVLASLWPGDCQTCGQSLGSTPPALLIDDLGILIKASLHHRACRAPTWNDSLVITTSSTELLTWRTVVLLLPFDIRGREIRVAGLLVNPGLEEVWLRRDGDEWHPASRPRVRCRGTDTADRGDIHRNTHKRLDWPPC